MADGIATRRILLDIPITFEAGDKRVHTAMVGAVVGGVATKLILDTGSSDHVFTRELADAAQLPMEPAEPGTDSTDSPVPTWSLGELAVDIGGQAFELHDVVAIPGPPPFAAWGVGGFLSPQHLHPTAWVVLDLASEQLVLVEGEGDDVATWLAERSPGHRLLTLERLERDLTVLVHAAIEPFDPVDTLLDTGGKATMFVGGAVPGLEGESGGAGHGVGGSQIEGSRVNDRTLAVGDARLPVLRLVVRKTMDGHDGLIGIDVLRGTILAVSSDRTRPVFWLVPA